MMNTMSDVNNQENPGLFLATLAQPEKIVPIKGVPSPGILSRSDREMTDEERFEEESKYFVRGYD